MEAIDDIAGCCLQLLCRHLPVVNLSNLVCGESASQMPGHLMGTQMGSIGKNGKQLALSGIFCLGFVAREWSEMASKVRDMIEACKDIQ